MLEHPDITRVLMYGELRSPTVACDCDLCGREIHIGDDYYDINGEFICERCITRNRKTAGED